jgi:uncharacterized protein involved in type VI secretion and phage assembly
MTDDVVGLIQAIVKDQLRSFRTADLAVVSGVYPHESASDSDNYACDVTLRDSGLELKRVPVGTPRIGAVAIPNKDDLVLVQYLGGDIHSAIITTRVFNDVDRPPVSKGGEFVYVSPDSPASGIRRMYLEFPNGNKLTLDDDKLLLEMGSSTVTVNHDGDVKIESGGKLSIDTQGDTSVSVTGNLELKASGDVKLEGANVSIKGQANATVEADASATLKGAAVKVAGQIDLAAA